MWEQDCAPAPGCPADGLDPAWCVLDPAPFVATFVEDQVVAISVDADAVAALGLLPGSWWTAWSDGASCDRVVATFEVTP